MNRCSHIPLEYPHAFILQHNGALERITGEDGFWSDAIDLRSEWNNDNTEKGFRDLAIEFLIDQPQVLNIGAREVGYDQGEYLDRKDICGPCYCEVLLAGVLEQ